MKEVRVPLRINAMRVGDIIMNSNIDDILFVIEDEIDRKEIHEKES